MTSGKKVPQKVEELEMFQVYEQIRSNQKQIDMIKNFTSLAGNSLMAVAILLLIVTQDYLDFINGDVGKCILKIVLSLVIIAMMTYQYQKRQATLGGLMDQIRHEKKGAKKVKNTLSNFDTRIVSQIRASPASFAKIITNEGFYHDFRFDHHP